MRPRRHLVRRDEPMTYRSDLDALEARHAALDVEVSRTTAERDRTATLVEEAKTRLRLPVLDNIRVASPCNASWDDMVGDDQVRHCGICDKDVFNLSNLTREDAEAVITATEGALCTRYYRRADGTIITSDCSVGMRRARRRRLIVAGVTVMVAAVGALGYEVSQRERVERVTPSAVDLSSIPSWEESPQPSEPPVVDLDALQNDLRPTMVMGQMVQPLPMPPTGGGK
jgi:hypothetical protein